MHLSEIPAELNCLNSLEQHLIARHIPFMKLLCLPRGRQRACHGPCVSVPINNTDVTNILPRNECDDKMIRVKLKRKLTLLVHVCPHRSCKKSTEIFAGKQQMVR